MITSGLKVVIAFILLCVLLIIGYDQFKTLQSNKALYREIRLQLALRNDPTRKLDGSPFIGDTFLNFELPDISNRIWKLSDIQSLLKVVIIFSIDDCPLCLQEYPLWRKIAETYQQKEIAVIGIAHHTDKEDLILFAKERSLYFPILLDIENRIREKMGFKSSPLRILLDAENEILEVAVPDANLQHQKAVLANLAERIKQIR